ncbi:MAG TPA: hypothetical protein VN849_07785 [Stellaceae bacterium]|nr:hypothetical protein [Stellaceae bacterium]
MSLRLCRNSLKSIPLMAWAQSHHGEVWWTPKLVALVLLVSQRAMLAGATLTGAFACFNMINVG